MTSNFYTSNIQYEIIKLLQSAKESVKICVAWINGGIYTPILESLALRGIKVQVIFNNDRTNQLYGIKPSHLYEIYPLSTQNSNSIMHHKFCIIDDEILINGSYNWSNSAEKNIENISVHHKDYNLLVKFLHEFYDLISYYEDSKSIEMQYCHCKSNKYNLAILGSETGNYDSSVIELWEICKANSHISLLHESHEQHVRIQLGLKDMPTFDEYDPKDAALSEFDYIRQTIKAVKNYFNSESSIKIHAVGEIGIANWNEHIEYGEDPEYVISMIWVSSYFRNIIPDVIYDDFEFEGTHKIISRHAT